MHNTDLLAPEYSPNALKKSGVRRVNNLPLIIALGALALFVVLIAMVAVKRAKLQNEPVKVVQTNRETPDSLALAKGIIGDRQGGIIPSNSAKTITNRLVLPVAVIDNPDLPPLPPKEEVPLDQELERLRQVKSQLFEEAVKAKTAIEYNPTHPLPIGSGQASDPHFLDDVPIETLKRTAQPSPHILGGREDEDRWVLHSTVKPPRTPYELRAGSVIPGIMISGIRSDLPGQIRGQVSQNVYDTATGNHLLIPQGTQLMGLYSAEVSYGQDSLLIAWQRLTFPDGKVLDLGSMPGTDSAGFAGFRDQVDNHYWRVFGSALLMSGVVAGISYSQNQHQPMGTNNPPSASSVLSQALGQQLGDVTAQLIAKNLTVAPHLKIRSGFRFNILVVKDLVFKKPYQAFDYR